MAILNKIRQRSLFLILVIALALFSFVLADLFKNSSGFSSSSQNIVATINGVDIKRDEFMNKVENAQRQYGNSMSSTQAMNNVWDQEVRNAVFDTQYNDLGLTVERDYIRSLLEKSLSGFEEFKNDLGLFDENKLNQFNSIEKTIISKQKLIQVSQNNCLKLSEELTKLRTKAIHGIEQTIKKTLAELSMENAIFKIELSQDKLKVNGKKQPDTLRNEFLQLYKKTKGKALSKKGKFKYEIKID